MKKAKMSPDSYLGYLAITRTDTGHILPRVMRIVEYDEEFKELVGIDVSEEDTPFASQYCLPPEALLVFVLPSEEEAYWRDPEAFVSDIEEEAPRGVITCNGKAPSRTRSRWKPLPES